MRKFLHWMFLLMLIGSVGTTQGQTFSYVCDFETDSDTSGWVFANSTSVNKWVIDSAVNNTTDGNRSLYVSNNNGVAHAYSTSSNAYISAYREFVLDAGVYDLSYDWISEGESRAWDYLRVSLVPSSATIGSGTSAPGNFFSMLPTGWIALDGGEGLNRSSSWTTKSEELVIATAGTYRLVFTWVNDGSGGSQPPAAIDNIEFRTQTCPKPINLTVSNIMVDGATISWTPMGATTAWELEYGPMGFESGTGTVINSVFDTFYVLTGLSSSMAYEVHVKSDCSGEYSHTTSIGFRTACGEVTYPLFENFESYEYGDFPACWYQNGSDVEIEESSSYAFSGMMSLALRDNSAVASPRLSVEEGEHVGVYFGAKVGSLTYGGGLEVGYITDTVNWNYTMVKLIEPLDNKYHFYEVDFDNVELDGDMYIVFRQVGCSSAYQPWCLDDITIFQLGTCRAPKNVKYTNVTSSSATVSWNCRGVGADFQLQYEKGGTPIMVSTTNGDSTVVLNNLEANSNYNVKIRSMCSGTDSSYWQECAILTTEPECDQLASVVINDLSSTSISFNWVFSNRGTPGTGILLRYKVEDSEDAWTELNLTGNGYIVTGLQINTSYEVEISTLCGTDTSDAFVFSVMTPSGEQGELTGNGETMENLPIYGYFEYGYSQSIYPARSVVNIDSIRGIAYHSDMSSMTRNITVYITDTSKSSYSSTTDNIRGSALTQVYTGQYTFSGTGWDTIMFTTPYKPNGGNIVITMVDNTGDYMFMYPSFYVHDGSSLYKQRDYSPIPATTTESLSMSNKVPDIRFIGNYAPATCMAPLVACVESSSSSITLSWVAGLNETSWIVDYRVMGSSDWINFSPSTTDTSATITGLITGCAYEFRVGSLCTEDTLYSTVVGYTSCGVGEIPYYENFESGILNPCWYSGVMNPASAYYFPEVETGYLYMPEHSYVVLSNFNAELSTLQLRFKMDVSGEMEAPIMIGVVSDQNSISTFVPLDTVFVDVQNLNADVIGRLNSYEGNGGYIALRTGRYEVGIDDLYIESIPMCPQPMHVHITALGGTYINLSWDADASASMWNVVIVPTGSAITTGTPVSTNDNEISLTGLTPSTTYDIYVSAVCDNESSPSAVTTITTGATDPMELPYNTNFMDVTQNAKWSYFSHVGSNVWSIGSAAGNGNANALYISSDNGQTNSYETGNISLSMAYIPISIPENGQYVFEYDWKSVGENNYDYSRMALVKMPYNFASSSNQRSDYKYELPTGWIAVDNGLLQGSSEWSRLSKALTLTQGTYYLTTIWCNDGGGGSQPPMAIDNISVVRVSCSAPTGLIISDITSSSATISWNTDVMASNGWEVNVNNEEPIVVTDTFYTFNDLDPNMGYTVSVRTLCSENDTSLFESISFFTPCGDILSLPYATNFDVETPSNINSDPHCWTIGTDDYPSVSTQYSDNPSLHFYCYSYSYPNNLASLPKLGTDINVRNVELQFRARALYSGSFNKIQVGVCSVAGDINTFVPVDTITNMSNDWSDYYVSFANYTGTGKYVTLMVEGQGYESVRIMVDDLVLQGASQCARPTTAYIDRFTHNSAHVAWVDTNAVATYRVAWSTRNNVNAAEHEVNGITGHSYDITNLSSSTTYYVWVASECTNIDTVSNWVNAGSVTTSPSCGAITDLIVTDIDATRATVSWRAPILGNTATDYIITYVMGANPAVVDTVQETYYFMDNLLTDSNYTVSVTTICNQEVSASNSITFMPKVPFACNEIGHGDITSSYCPTNTNWGYTLSQMLYLSDECTLMGDTIHGISFERRLQVPITRTIVVYMGETETSELTGTFIPLTGLTEVYNGSWTMDSSICKITFTTPFVRSDHGKNLLIVVDDNTASYVQTTPFVSDYTDRYLVQYNYGDGMDIPITSGAMRSYSRPNIIFDATCETPTCYAPSVVISNLTDRQVDLAWRAGADETAWKVEYRMNGDEVWTTVHASTTSTTASIANLQPGKLYYFRVGSICGTEVVYKTISVNMPCGLMPLPFYENFNNVGWGDFDENCWTVGGYEVPDVVNLIGNGAILRMFGDSYIALPKMDGNLNTLQIRLRYVAVDSSIMSVVGYMNNANSIASFHPIDTVRDLNNIVGYYNTVRFNNIPADADGYIAIYHPENLAYAGFIDDIIVETIRTCVEPTDVSISNVTATTANVSWEGNATNYIVEYGSSGFALGSGTRVNVTGLSTQLSNLQPATNYDVYVYSVCGSDTSHASNVAYMNTECAPLTELPYVMNFDLSNLPALTETGIIPICWSVPYLENEASVVDEERPQICYNDENYAINGDHMFKMEAKGIVALPEMSMNLNTLCVRFNDYISTGSSRLVVGVLDHIGTGCESTFQPIDTIAPAILNQSVRYVVFFNQYTGTGKYIAFRNIDNTGSATSLHYLDSVVVEEIPSCAEVTRLHVVSASPSTITIDWEDISPATNWQIEYGESGFELGTGTAVNVTSHPTTISGLEMLHQYDFWVRPICSDTDTGNWTYRPLAGRTTICAAPFVSTTAPNGANEQHSRYPFAPYYGYSYSQTIVTANQIAGQSSITGISFSALHNSNNMLQNCRIWIGHTSKSSYSSTSDWYPTDSMQLVYTGNLDYEAGLVTILLDSVFNYNGTSNIVIAFDRDNDDYENGHNFETVSATSSLTLYQSSDWQDMDPSTLEFSGTLASAQPVLEFISCDDNACPTPIISAVTDLTYETATINWVDEGGSYQVAIRTQEETSMSDPIDVDTNFYTFTNLTPNVGYVYYVRQVCGEGVFSEWAEGGFTTADLPCFTPQNLSVVSKTAETITLTWNPGNEGQTKWSVHVFNTLMNQVDTVESIPYTITGLTGGFTYRIAVNAICATNYVSDWSDTIDVTTVDCLPVSNVAVSNITENSAKVTWTAGRDETEWQINYGDQDFGQGEGVIVDASTNSHTLTNLVPNKTYDVYVRAVCSADFTSVWSEVVRFTTLQSEEGIDGVDGNFVFTIYPNPTSGATTISLSGVAGKVQISVVDMNGRTAISENVDCGDDCEKVLDVAGLAQGTYFVRVLGDNINSVRKLIVR